MRYCYFCYFFAAYIIFLFRDRVEEVRVVDLIFNWVYLI
jgi:hypothetical protein